MMKAAAQTFFHRYSAMIQLPTQEKYIDSIEGFCDYIAEATSFITSLLDGDMINPPFQVCYMSLFVDRAHLYPCTLSSNHL